MSLKLRIAAEKADPIYREMERKGPMLGDYETRDQFMLAALADLTRLTGTHS